jgi:NAD(P)-dependent dehydrogenase (short-subunit alcohol dehydrogenase family)
MSSKLGKVAVVTGAGSGIGRQLALGLARRGARLALSDINDLALAETVEQATRLGAEVHTGHLDVSGRDAVEAYATDVLEHYGVVHQLYNNAGIAGGRGVLDTDWSEYERILAVNLWGVIHGTKAFLPHLIASGDGVLVNVSSLNGIMAGPRLSAYCATKFAVRGFTEALQIEMIAGRYPVRVIVVHPGGVRTNIATAALLEGERRGQLVTQEDRDRLRFYNEKLLRMPAERAAEIILAGVAAGRSRIIVGNDARMLDLLVRLLPRRYPRLIARSVPATQST